MANTTISFDIENTLLAEVATAIETILDRIGEESDVNLIKRCIELNLMKILNKKRFTDATWTEATSVFE